jgi:hypothetical protein
MLACQLEVGTINWLSQVSKVTADPYGMNVFLGAKDMKELRSKFIRCYRYVKLSMCCTFYNLLHPICLASRCDFHRFLFFMFNNCSMFSYFILKLMPSTYSMPNSVPISYLEFFNLLSSFLGYCLNFVSWTLELYLQHYFFSNPY